MPLASKEELAGRMYTGEPFGYEAATATAPAREPETGSSARNGSTASPGHAHSAAVQPPQHFFFACGSRRWKSNFNWVIAEALLVKLGVEIPRR